MVCEYQPTPGTQHTMPMRPTHTTHGPCNISNQDHNHTALHTIHPHSLFQPNNFDSPCCHLQSSLHKMAQTYSHHCPQTSPTESRTRELTINTNNNLGNLHPSLDHNMKMHASILALSMPHHLQDLFIQI